MNIVPDEARFAELFIYVAQRLHDGPGIAGQRLHDGPGLAGRGRGPLGIPRPGFTKINRILFASEFAHLRHRGEPITGVPYQKLRRGPTAVPLHSIRDALIADGSIRVQRGMYRGYPLDQVTPTRPANIQRFFNSPIMELTDQVIDDLWHTSGLEVDAESQREIGWRSVRFGEIIPYEAALLAPAFEITESMASHAAALVDELGGPFPLAVGDRREVTVTERLAAQAHEAFPNGLPQFESCHLVAATQLFERWFDRAPEAQVATGVKVWLSIDVSNQPIGHWPPIAFYAVLVDDHVELVDVTVEAAQDFWEFDAN